MHLTRLNEHPTREVQSMLPLEVEQKKCDGIRDAIVGGNPKAVNGKQGSKLTAMRRQSCQSAAAVASTFDSRRGPIWFPVNYTLIRALHEYASYYGDSLKVECPTGSSQWCTLEEVAVKLARRLTNIFLRVSARGGRRAVWGENEYFQTDPRWRDYAPFFEYFNGDTGAGCGVSHQTGWTALVVSLLYKYWELDARS